MDSMATVQSVWVKESESDRQKEKKLYEKLNLEWLVIWADFKISPSLISIESIYKNKQSLFNGALHIINHNQ